MRGEKKREKRKGGGRAHRSEHEQACSNARVIQKSERAIEIRFKNKQKDEALRRKN